MSDRRQLGDRWYTVEEAGAELIRLRQERDLAVAALRLYRDALATAASLIESDGDPVAEIGRRQIERARTAADGILGSMGDG